MHVKYPYLYIEIFQSSIALLQRFGRNITLLTRHVEAVGKMPDCCGCDALITEATAHDLGCGNDYTLGD